MTIDAQIKLLPRVSGIEPYLAGFGLVVVSFDVGHCIVRLFCPVSVMQRGEQTRSRFTQERMNRDCSSHLIKRVTGSKRTVNCQ